MPPKRLPVHDSIALFVKEIWLFEDQNAPDLTVLPFYADGFPGILFQKTAGGLFVQPHAKQMPELFLYGQTIQPIELEVRGNFELLVFQLFPFVLGRFFQVDARQLNDNCFDLLKNDTTGAVQEVLCQLKQASAEAGAAIVSTYLTQLFEKCRSELDFKVLQGIRRILEGEGQLSIAQIQQELNIHERSFERRFLAQTGISAKQFSKIVQFQQVLTDLSDPRFERLTDVVFKNGFADQSHFIRVFKAFTKQTPKHFAGGRKP